MKIAIDIVVVGSGPGGATTAALLAEAGREVLVIEKGAEFQLIMEEQFTKKELVTKYKNNGVTVALGNPKVSYVEGSCLGGGSEVNAGLYHRTPEKIISYWRERYEIKNLYYKDLIRYFEANEKDINVSYAPKEMLPPSSFKLYEGAKKLGWESAEIPRWVKYSADKKYVKQSMTQTFIPRALRAGAKIISETIVHSMKMTNGKWHLSASKKDGTLLEIDANNVFLCAGTVSTAQLLRKNKLSKLAGKSFHMHPSVKLVAKFEENVNFEGAGVPVHQVKEFSPQFSLGCSISSVPYLHLAMLDVKGGFEEVRNNWQRMSIYYAMVSDGGGNIINVPFFKDPILRYKLGNKGLENLRAGLYSLGKCLFAAGAIEIYPVVSGSKPIHNLDELKEFVDTLTPSRLNLITIHLFSSCPMGENQDLCVVDSHGKVHGHEGLYVNDGSLLCTAPTVNPQGTIMMLARRNCEYFLRNN